MPELIFPTLHEGQAAAFYTPGRNKVIRCGRRWGKSIFGAVWVSDGAAKGLKCGWFAPNYKFLREAWDVVKRILKPIAVKINESMFTIEVIGGGKIDFWTLDDENAGRSKEYHRVVLDEIAFAKDNVVDTWKRSIKPTMLTTRGRCLALSTPNGDSPDNFFWQLCNNPDHGFVEYYAPSWTNPYVPPEEIEALRRTEHPLVFQQEYAAEFIDWRSNSFFKIDDFLVNGQPVNVKNKPQYVLATIDTALKGGAGNDGTAVVYWAFNPRDTIAPLYILDWDIVEIEGAMLEVWLPSVFRQLDDYAKKLNCHMGSAGAYIEDKATGSILLQQGKNRRWPVNPIDSKITAVGKDARAVNASGYITQGKVKLTPEAYDKTTVFRGALRNHFTAQIFGFRIADPDANKRQDDLLDCMTYGVALSLGNGAGF